MKPVNYSTALLSAISPELKKRIEIISSREKKTPEEVIISFLSKGANTPSFLGAGC